tara:strand:- start:697 stop:1002 length:306 start_codon:yes stop_codon:yes gene_type:complete
MKKLTIIFFITFLIFFTAIIKNSTKKFEDEIFVTKENIQIQKKKLETIKLEHDYLSSVENLLDFHNLYFDEELKKKNILNIKIIDINQNTLKIKRLKFVNE